MKVLCDVCKGDEAAVYCCADEAALCGACDGRVHRANKLAGKHRRFSLLHPATPQQFPLCDICQEKRALLFCQEDRAILCKDCDAPIHSANDHTRKHSRFLLTGIKLSPSVTPATAAASSDCPGSVAVSTTTSEDAEEPPGDVTNVNQRGRLGLDSAPKQQKKLAAVRGAPVATKVSDKNSRDTAATAAGYSNSGKVMAEDRGAFCATSKGVSASAAAAAGGGSTISEYLIKELPGWHVEDLLLDASPAVHPAAFTFAKMTGNDLLPFLEADLDAAAFPTDDGGNLSAWWVPQVPVASALPPLPPSHDYGQPRQHVMGTGMSSELNKLAARHLQQQHQQQQHNRWATDDCFTVPEISTVQPHPQHNPPCDKRPRPASWCISS